MLAAAERGDVDAVIVRPPWFYGPHQPARQTQWLRAVRRGRFPLVGDGSQPALDGVHRQPRRTASCGPRPPAPTGAAYWIADAEPHTMVDVLATVRRGLRGRGARRCRAASPACPGSPAWWPSSSTGPLQRAGRYVQSLHVLGELKETIACDISRARAEIGYDPPPTCFEGMRASIRWCLRARARALMARTVLVTGGSGYFGSILVDRCLAQGDDVRVLDLNPSDSARPSASWPTSATSTPSATACEGVDVVLHNVAQVPLARDRALFWSVNVTGTANVLLAARDAGVAKVVHTSTSAIYGIPERNPVDEDSPARPLEAYGRAKLEAEVLCRQAAADGLDVSIIRPRTILGHGRLGLMAILFELVAEGAPVFVFDGGPQPLPARPRRRPGRRLPARRRPARPARPTTSAPPSSARCARRSRRVCDARRHRRSRSGRSPRRRPGSPCGRWPPSGRARSRRTTGSSTASRCGSTPPGPRTSWAGQPQHSNASMVIESYRWFLDHRDDLGGEGRLAPPVAGAHGRAAASCAACHDRAGAAWPPRPTGPSSPGSPPSWCCPLVAGAIALRRPPWAPVLDLAMTELRVRDVGGAAHPAHRPPGAHRRRRASRGATRAR